MTPDIEDHSIIHDIKLWHMYFGTESIEAIFNFDAYGHLGGRLRLQKKFSVGKVTYISS